MAVAAIPVSPFKGLMPFEEQDAAVFFGRERDRQLLIASLYASRLTILFGPAGVGKTSILQAGVAAHLHSRPNQRIIVFKDWESSPDIPLKNAILQEAKSVSLQVPQIDSNQTLARIGDELANYLDEPMMVVLDQFEDYLQSHRSSSESISFETELGQAVNRADSALSFLISIREDMLAKLDRLEPYIPQLFDNYFRLEHLNREQARLSIKGPIQVYNQDRSPDQQIQITDELVDEIILQVRTDQRYFHAHGRGSISPPLDSIASANEQVQVETAPLQLVMQRLWTEEQRQGSRELRLTTFSQLGGARGITQQHVNQVMQRFKPEEQDVAADLFEYLVTSTGASLALGAQDLAGFARLPVAAVEPVIETLSKRDVRIVRAVAGSQTVTEQRLYEIFHPVFIPAVLNWRTEFKKTAPFRDLRRNIFPVVILGIVAILLEPLLSGVPLVLGLVRFTASTALNTALLLQMYRWFNVYLGLYVRPLPFGGLGGRNLGIVLGILLSLLWYVATEWQNTLQFVPMGAVVNADYLNYLAGATLPTLLFGLLILLTMRVGGGLTDRFFKRFEIGYYGAYLAVCSFCALLVLSSILSGQSLGFISLQSTRQLP